jgi:uncharacterized protein with GYD domain
MKYIVLGKCTDHGRKTTKDVKKRIETAQNLVNEQNGSMSLCFTMGEYDFVAIVDMPNEEGMVKVRMTLNIMNNVITETLKAWTDSEFVKIVSEL